MPARPCIAALALAAPAPALAQTLPRTGFDVLPLAAGVALLLAAVALRRRPHARR